MDMERHFSTLAPHYRSLRTTDLAPILFIKRHLRRLRRILAADIGCGAGRYDLKLCEQLGLKLFFYCVDINKDMLAQLRAYMQSRRANNFSPVVAPSERLPLLDESLDCAFSFNAVHHFDIQIGRA